ncbi:MAG TPA: hypothetical protein VGF06_01420 [Terriglobales bacterium]|jgi:hypothetical protein
MPSRKQKLQILGVSAVLLLFAAAVGCKGFFVDSPDSLTISPDPVTFTDLGNPQQLTAQASFGSSSKDVTNSATWQSSNGCGVAVSAATLGSVTAISSGYSVTITATFNGVSDTVSATTPTGIQITPCSSPGQSPGQFKSGDSITLTATSGGTDVTTTTTWTSSSSGIVHFTGNTAIFGPTTGKATITASDGSDPDGMLTVTVQ